MEDLQDWSFKLYDVLELVGASEGMRLLKRQLTNEAEILDTILHVNHYGLADPRREYFVGGYYEASVTPDLNSDIDTVFVNENVLVVTNAKHPTDRSTKYLLTRDEVITSPGYVKLQPVSRGKPLTVHDFTVQLIFSATFDLPDRGNLQVSEDQHGNIFYTNKNNMRPDKCYSAEKNGPALAIYKEDGHHEFDHVFVFECVKIPKFGKDWLCRQRNYGWPSQKMLEELSQMTCFVVPKGHEESCESDLEWRMSFTLQERKLMTSLNPVQHKVYVILKMLKRDIVQQNKALKGALGSYELKTCLLYVIENTPARYWVKANLLGCLLYTMSVFTSWLRCGYCPNFFIPEQNLFFKTSFKHQRKTLINIFEGLLRDSYRFIFHIQCDHIGDLLTTVDSGVSETARARLCKYKWQLMYFTGGKVLICSRSLVFVFEPDRGLCPIDVETFERFVILDSRFSDYRIEEKRRILSYILPWMHLYVAIGIACRPQSVANTEETMVYHFNQAVNTDVMNRKLAMATVYLSRKHFTFSLRLLEQLDQHISRHHPSRVVTYCGCRYLKTNFGQSVVSTIHDITVKDLLKTHWAFCIFFLHSHKAIVPSPLHYEMHRSLGSPAITETDLLDWHDKIVVDTKIYLYFLLYLVYKQLNEKEKKTQAIKNMHLMLRVDVELTHRETAYNLLGWIYMQEELYGYAARCFIMSWDNRETHNAVKFHIWDLIQKFSESRRKRLLHFLQ